MNKVKAAALWTLQILLAALFVMSALAKLTSNPEMVERFRQWGYPDNFYYLVGATELLGAIGLLIPRVAAYGASALMVIMVGASLTHLLHEETSRVAFTGVIFLLLAGVAYARRPAF
ncbi:MAG: DoxX family protein, partial [Terriglobia bacterium]